MDKNDVMNIISISNKVKRMWDYMVTIEEHILKQEKSMIEPLFGKFMEKGYYINDMFLQVSEYIDFESDNSKEFFDDILYMVIKLEYLIEKNIYLIPQIILTSFKDFKKSCTQLRYWRHESYIRIKFDIYSI